MDPVAQIAAAVLYEGYLLWPYRRSARKNQKRWTFGGVYPRAYSDACGGHDPWRMQTQCLVTGRAPVVTVKVRFLHVIERNVARARDDGTLEFVDELRIGGERHLAWDEATEREIRIEGMGLSEPLKQVEPTIRPIAIPAGSSREWLQDESGEAAGALVREWRALEGAVRVRAERLHEDLFRLTVGITNTSPWTGHGHDRERALRQTFVSTHTLLGVVEGEFVSLMDPPHALAAAAGACENIGTWPVLAGEEGERRTLLSAPIILYDYPKIAPESPGDLFDGTEIDELLLLNILTLTDAEKEEMRATDPRAREILERSESLTPDDFLRLHGVVREFGGPGHRTDPFSEQEWSAPRSVVVGGVRIGKGSRVRLRPRGGADVWDLVLAGKIAIVEAIEEDTEDRLHVAVTIEEDPGRDLGAERVLGHRFFFAPEEVEPLPEGL